MKTTVKFGGKILSSTLLAFAALCGQNAFGGQIYYPFDFGVHDGNSWQVWTMNGSNIYPASIVEYIGGYLHERWPLQTYSGGFYCSSCAEYSIFEGNPVLDGKVGSARGNTLNIPQSFGDNATRYIDIQWSASGYHWQILNADGTLFNLMAGDATYPVTTRTYDAFWEGFYGYGPGVKRDWNPSAYGTTGVPGGHGIATTPLKVKQGASISQEAAVVSLPSMPLSAPAVTLLPAPNKLSGQFTSFYTANRSTFDAPTQSFFDAKVIELGQWLNSHKSSTVSNVFIVGANAIDAASKAASIALSFLDFSKVFSGGAAALGTDAQQLATIGDYSLGTASQAGILPDTADKVRSITSATLNVALNYDNPYVLLVGLNATIWGDWVVPQMRKYGEDPPDPNYKTAVIPQRVLFTSLPASPDSTADLLLRTELQSAFDMGMFLQAANQTLDKYAGALNGADAIYATYQMKLFITYMDQYNQAARKAAADVKALSDYLARVGFTAANQKPAILAAVQAQVRQSGFSQDVLNYLTAVGYSGVQIAQLKLSFLAYTPSSVVPDISFLAQLSSASMNLTSTVAASRLSNLSVRTTAGSGDTTLIAGFVASGSSQEKLLIRGIGSGLSQFNVAGVLTNVKLSLFNSQGIQLTQNTNWEAAVGSASAASSLFSQLGAFPLQAGSKDAALNIFVFPGSSYSAQITSNDGTSGIALVEIYEDSTFASTSRLVNISARCQVNTGGGILIAGFVVSGNSSKQLLIRGVGPSLSIFGVGGVLANPKLQVFQGTTLIAENDDWGQSTNAATIQPVSQSVGAFALPSGSRDSVLFLTLPPGSYTAQVSGVDATTGVGLVEIYEVP